MLCASISIRSRITSILRRCSAIGCSPQGETQPATKARSGSCEPPWPQGPTTPRWPSRTRGSTNSSMPSMGACSLATTSTASSFWNGRSPTRGCRDRTTRSPARRTPDLRKPERGRAVRGPQSSHNFKSVAVEIRGTRRAPPGGSSTARIPPRQQPSWAPLCRIQTPRHVARLFRRCGSPVFRAARRAAPLRKWV